MGKVNTTNYKNKPPTQPQQKLPDSLTMSSFNKMICALALFAFIGSQAMEPPANRDRRGLMYKGNNKWSANKTNHAENNGYHSGGNQYEPQRPQQQPPKEWSNWIIFFSYLLMVMFVIAIVCAAILLGWE